VKGIRLTALKPGAQIGHKIGELEHPGRNVSPIRRDRKRCSGILLS